MEERVSVAGTLQSALLDHRIGARLVRFVNERVTVVIVVAVSTLHLQGLRALADSAKVEVCTPIWNGHWMIGCWCKLSVACWLVCLSFYSTYHAPAGG